MISTRASHAITTRDLPRYTIARAVVLLEQVLP